jgi:hypothetical protein
MVHARMAAIELRRATALVRKIAPISASFAIEGTTKATARKNRTLQLLRSKAEAAYVSAQGWDPSVRQNNFSSVFWMLIVHLSRSLNHTSRGRQPSATTLLVRVLLSPCDQNYPERFFFL